MGKKSKINPPELFFYDLAFDKEQTNTRAVWERIVLLFPDV